MATAFSPNALFFSVGTGLGGIIGPYLFAKLVETEELSQVALGYYLGAAVMIAGGLIEAFLGVDAEQRSLETSPRRCPRNAPAATEPSRADAKRNRRSRSVSFGQSAGSGRSAGMEFILWLIAVVLVVYGIVSIVRGSLLFGVVLIVVGLLVGPGGVSIFT